MEKLRAAPARDNPLIATVHRSIWLPSGLTVQAGYRDTPGAPPITTDIWHRIEQPVMVSNLCAFLADEYDAAFPTIQRDVLALLEQLMADGFIETQDHSLTGHKTAIPRHH